MTVEPPPLTPPSRKGSPSPEGFQPPTKRLRRSPSPVVGDEPVPFTAQPQPPATRETEVAHCLGMHVLVGSALSTAGFKPLRDDDVRHHALSVYKGFKIPEDTVLILSTTVQGGIGDLEHLIQVVRGVQALRQLEPFSKLVVFILQGEACSGTGGGSFLQEAWEAKIAILKALGPDQVFYRPEDLGDRDVEKLYALSDLQAEDFCQIDVSFPAFLPVQTVDDSDDDVEWEWEGTSETQGCISEYGSPCHTDLLEYSDEDSLRFLVTGFIEGTAGLWMDADPVFHPVRCNLSVETKQVLFGSNLTEEEDSKWDVGIASFRKDFARLAWIDLRLAQVPKDKNCVLIVSSFWDSDLERREIAELCCRYGFGRCILIESEEKEVYLRDPEDCEEEVALRGPKDYKEEEVKLEGAQGDRTLRVVHMFISEEELPMLIQRAGSGSLGGAGDTACARGLIGKYPMFIEWGKQFHKRWEEAAEYLTSRGFTRVAAWIQGCLAQSRDVPSGVESQAFYSLRQLMTPELVWEWQEFCRRVRDELEIGPWVDLYVHRCVAMSGEKGDAIKALEDKYFKNEDLSDEAYTEEMKKVLNEVS